MMSNHLRILSKHFRNLKLHRNSSSLNRNVRIVDDFTVTTSLPFQPVPRMNLFDRLWVHASTFKDQVAVVSAETNKSYTFVQLQKLIGNFGTSLLKKLHLRPDDVVAVAVPNCPEYPVVALGILRAGCIFTPVNPAYKTFELLHQFTITKPKVVVTIAQAYPTIAKVLDEAKIDAKFIIIDNPGESIPDGAARYSELAENGEADYSILDRIEKDHDNVAIIPFSSGTTGMPKGVEITYKNILAGFDIMTHEKYILPKISDGKYQEIIPCVLPFFHIYGLVITMMGHLSVGAKLITMSSFDPMTYIEILAKERPSILYVVPLLAEFIAKFPLVTEKHLEHLNFIFCGGAPLSKSVADAVLQKMNAKTQFLQGYAVTETTCMGTMMLKGSGTQHLMSCGEPALNVELRMCDADTGNPVPIGEPGEVCIRSPAVTKGYYLNEKATKDSMTSDGFYRSGDLGVYKPGEGLYILDRIKELIKVKGMQVTPTELEALLRSHPSVLDAGVIGIPHKTFGEVPKAFVVTGDEITVEELKEFVAEKVIDYKRLHEVVFVDEIPKNATGKILRKELRKM